jgi:hypothetical protein
MDTMKKLIATLAAVSMTVLGTSVTIVTPAHAISVSDYCTANGDLGLPSHGACVGGLNKSVPATCKQLQDLLPAALYEALFGGTSVGACVSTVRHAIKAI